MYVLPKNELLDHSNKKFMDYAMRPNKSGGMSSDPKNFLGIGWKFPVLLDDNLSIKMSKYEADIKEAILIILGTAKGERVMLPEFGCDIHDFVFESMNTSMLDRVNASVREALTRWEPRIELVDVTVTRDDTEIGRIIINIEYIVRSTNTQFNLVYPFFLTEGG
jgi:phage baseplate assembly protein W